ncbi:MAG: aquaporin [Armatimonadaceae bacterium]
MKRRYLSELVGTFGIVFAPVALSASGRMVGGDASLAAAAWVSGLVVLAMIYALGPISAAHFNPAVTVGFAAAGRFPWRRVPGYALSQAAGAILAALLTSLLFGGTGYGTHIPNTAFPLWRAVLAEATISFFLMLVIMAVATDRRAAPGFAGVAIGLVVVVGVWLAGPLTGGSMNPARSLGPALVSQGAALANWWVYLLGPMLGTVAAARLYETLRGGDQYIQNAPADIA